MINLSSIRSFLDSLGISEPKTQAIICEEDPNSYYSEQYKSLASKLLSPQEGRQLKSVIITSSQPGEGKTTTVCNLAITMVRTFSKKVIIVDGDLRKPSIHGFFEAEVEPGLTDYLADQTNSNPLGSFLKNSGIENLKILPAGSISQDPGQLLNNRKMTNLNDSLSEICDFVIFDTSPVLFTSDAQALGVHGDLVLFLVQAGVTPRKMIQQAFSRLRDTGSEPDACIMTNTKRTKAPLKYLYGSNYNNYYD